MRTLKRRYLYVLLFVLQSAIPAFSEDHVWVIGGGPNVYAGGVHIEYNISWVLNYLRETTDDRNLHLYFGSGTDSTKDVVEYSRPHEDPAHLQPLARVFGDQEHNGESYRKSELTGISGTTRRQALLDALESDFADLGPGDRVFIMYNGHGTHNAEDTAENTLRLWGNSNLSARDFESLLSEIPKSIPTRFLMPQCYSGGFSAVIHPGANDVLDLANGNRCGFMASSDRRQSEGCSSSTKVGDYRDYTTHFFAAFQGVTRQGDMVSGNIDFDADGEVTMFDAHLFALVHGYSRSMPRSTSETYLEKWQPWFLRWQSLGDVPDNVYGKLSREMTRRLGLPERDRPLMAELHNRKADLRSKLISLEAEKLENEKTAAKLQVTIRQELEVNWPEIRHPYTKNYQQFLSSGLNAAQAHIMRHPDYEQLVAIQNRQLEIDELVLAVQRDTVEMDKVLRLRKLARLEEQFKIHANSEERESWQQIKSCETSTL
jgi:hypothetical protein